MLKKRKLRGFGLDCTKHIGPIWFWRCYQNLGKFNDKEEFGLGFGSDIYFYFGFLIHNGWIEFVFRISGVGRLPNSTPPNDAIQPTLPCNVADVG